MTSRVPPLNALRVFESAARHLSLRQAAAELSVTPGAVSQQLRLLEASIGAPLFERLPRGLRLTPAGQQLAPAASQAMRLLEDTVERLRVSRPVVRFSGAPTLCTRWLVPRLGGFFERHPGMELQIDASQRLIDLASEPFDVVIRHGHGRETSPALERRLLFADDVIAVCAPEVAAAIGDRPENLGRAKLLCWSTQDHWPRWLRAKGLEAFEAADRASFSLLMLVLDAALAGQGFAVTSPRLVAPDLARGRLVSVFGPAVATGYSYYAIARPEALAKPHVRAFVDWVLEQAADGT